MYVEAAKDDGDEDGILDEEFSVTNGDEPMLLPVHKAVFEKIAKAVIARGKRDVFESFLEASINVPEKFQNAWLGEGYL